MTDYSSPSTDSRRSGPEGIKLFPCSTQVSTKFILLKDLCKENMKKSSCLEPHRLEYDNYWTSTKFVQIMPLGQTVLQRLIQCRRESIKYLLV